MGQYKDFNDEVAIRPTVLCIDDDPEISRALGLRLEAHNINVLRAYHGMHGLWQAMTESPDLIITDIQMPQGSGEYIVECLKSNSETKYIPVFVLTGKKNPKVEKKLRNLGVDEYFVKPCDFDDMRERMEPYLAMQLAGK